MNIPELSKGNKISKNFILNKRIKNLNEFYKVLETHRSLFARADVRPTAFYFSWQIKLIKNWIDLGWFWTIKRIDNV
jgi:hypothetical protein